MRRKKRKYVKKKAFVEHHITYDPEWTVNIYHGEHMIMTWLQRRKKWSKGFIVALKEMIKNNVGDATELKKEDDTNEHRT